jgi:hypothetical protein
VGSDVRLLARELERLHPNPWHDLSPLEWADAVERLAAGFDGFPRLQGWTSGGFRKPDYPRTNEAPHRRGSFSERMMGLEPTTFCVARSERDDPGRLPTPDCMVERGRHSFDCQRMPPTDAQGSPARCASAASSYLVDVIDLDTKRAEPWRSPRTMYPHAGRPRP